MVTTGALIVAPGSDNLEFTAWPCLSFFFFFLLLCGEWVELISSTDTNTAFVSRVSSSCKDSAWPCKRNSSSWVKKSRVQTVSGTASTTFNSLSYTQHTLTHSMLIKIQQLMLILNCSDGWDDISKKELPWSQKWFLDIVLYLQSVIFRMKLNLSF